MKAAIVTGASSGIGQAISKLLLEQHYRVYGIGRDFSKSVLASEEFIELSWDLSNTSVLAAKIKEIKSRDEIHILVNNAGVGYFGPHEELNPQKIHEMVSVNLEAPMILSQLLLRDIKKHQGYIFNISSVTALKSNTHGCAYGATKAGLTSFSDSLFDEVRKYGVKVVSIHPDMTKSNFYRNSDFREGSSPDTYLLPEEVAQVIDMVLKQREGILVSEITLKPQKHQLRKL